MPQDRGARDACHAKKAGSAVEYGIGLLASRSLPERKLREKIAGRFGAAETDAAIVRLVELGMVDDAAWAERFARDRFERIGKGRHRIREELAARGIDAAHIERALDRVLSVEAEREKARAVLERMQSRLGRGSLARSPIDATGKATPESGARSRDRSEPGAARNRLYRRMLARGFPAALVRDLLDVS